eukprot:5363107-Pyramimonas_sp.AAC.1
MAACACLTGTVSAESSATSFQGLFRRVSRRLEGGVEVLRGLEAGGGGGDRVATPLAAPRVRRPYSCSALPRSSWTIEGPTKGGGRVAFCWGRGGHGRRKW